MIDDQTVRVVAEWAKQEPLVLEVYLFGSRVRGKSKDGDPVRPNSDLDIAIRMDLPPEFSDQFYPWYDLKRRATAMLCPLFSWPLRFELLNGCSPLLERYVAECSRLIFSRQEKAPPPKLGSVLG